MLSYFPNVIYVRNQNYTIMAKTRITPFARLLIFLLIFLPLVFAGASYYNGEDPVANVKNLLGMDTAPQTEQVSTPASDSPSSSSAPATFENVQDMRDEIKQLKQNVAVLEKQLVRCQTAGVE